MEIVNHSYCLKWRYGVFLICQFRGVILPQRKIYRRNVVANHDRITEINEKTYWTGQLSNHEAYRDIEIENLRCRYLLEAS